MGKLLRELAEVVLSGVLVLAAALAVMVPFALIFSWFECPREIYP
jgi:hypothetical protein